MLLYGQLQQNQSKTQKHLQPLLIQKKKERRNRKKKIYTSLVFIKLLMPSQLLHAGESPQIMLQEV